MQKYRITDEELIVNGARSLHRIQALCDFGDVRKGDYGGWVETEDNLSQEGTCWLYDDAKAEQYSRVLGDAKLYDNACIDRCAVICDRATMKDYSYLSDHPRMFESAAAQNSARITECSNIGNFVTLQGLTTIRGNSFIRNAYVGLTNCFLTDAYVTSNRSIFVFTSPVPETATSLSIYRSVDSDAIHRLRISFEYIDLPMKEVDRIFSELQEEKRTFVKDALQLAEKYISAKKTYECLLDM